MVSVSAFCLAGLEMPKYEATSKQCFDESIFFHVVHDFAVCSWQMYGKLHTERPSVRPGIHPGIQTQVVAVVR